VKDRAFNDQRYFICDQKLAGLGWTERTSWEEGLKVTIDWYLKNGFSSYWEHGDVEVLLVVPICYAYACTLAPCCASGVAAHPRQRTEGVSSDIVFDTDTCALRRQHWQPTRRRPTRRPRQHYDQDTKSPTPGKACKVAGWRRTSRHRHLVHYPLIVASGCSSNCAQAEWPTMLCFHVLALPSIPLYIC
jgi:hypothetical protein